METPPTAVQGPDPPRRRRRFVGWIHRLEDRLFPALTGPTSNRRGVLASHLREWPGALAALVIGIVTAALLESTMAVLPVPAGGDPGQWTSTSYAYVGLP